MGFPSKREDDLERRDDGLMRLGAGRNSIESLGNEKSLARELSWREEAIRANRLRNVEYERRLKAESEVQSLRATLRGQTAARARSGGKNGKPNRFSPSRDIAVKTADAVTPPPCPEAMKAA